MKNSEVQFYLRNAKKQGFLVKSSKQLLTDKQLKQIIQNKCRVPIQHQILYYNGQVVSDNTNVQLIEKGIVHVIDARNVGKSKMKLLVKRLHANTQEETFQVNSNTSIQNFIKDQLSSIYEEPADKLFLVYSGRQLKKQKSFLQQNIESDSQVLCVHEDKDKKKKSQPTLEVSSLNSFKTKTITNKNNNTVLNHKKAEFLSVKINSQNQQNNEQDKLIEEPQKEQMSYKKQKTLIKSIDQIKCHQYQSDEDSQEQQNSGFQSILGKLPQESKRQMPQTDKNSPQVKINHVIENVSSEPNFKKIKKATSKQNTNNVISDPNTQTKQMLQQLLNQKDLDQEIQQQTPKFKTRQQIFDLNTNTYQSVIDQTQQKVEQNPLSPVDGEKQYFFSPPSHYHQEQIYDSQMNSQYIQIQSTNIQVKYNQGFMNLSNTNFLQASNPDNHTPTKFNVQSKFSISECDSLQKSSSIVSVNQEEIVQKLIICAPELLNNNYFPHRQEVNPQSVLNTIVEKQGDSLDISKNQEQNKKQQESQDNLFVDYRKHNNNQNKQIKPMVHHQQASQSNLLSDIYQNQNNMTNLYSITFNLQPNPDDYLNSKIRQNTKNIVIQENQMTEQEINDENEQKINNSDCQTNFRQSQEPSYIHNNQPFLISNNNNNQANNQNLDKINKDSKGNENENELKNNDQNFQTGSLIDNLISVIEYRPNVNQVAQQNSDIQIQYPSNRIQLKNDEIVSENKNNLKYPSKQQPFQKHNNHSQQISSNIFVAYQPYEQMRDNFKQNSLLNGIQQNKNIDGQSNLLYSEFRGDNLEYQHYKYTYQNDHINDKKQTQQIQPIKIEQEEQKQSPYKSLYTRETQYVTPKQNQAVQNFPNQSVQLSAAFVDVTELYFDKKIIQDYNFLNSPSLYETPIKNQPNYKQSQIQDSIQENYKNNQHYSFIEQNQQTEYNPIGLLPGDLIFSTDKILSPQQVLKDIINGFQKCF